MRSRVFAAVSLAALALAACPPPPPCSSFGGGGAAPPPDRFGALEKLWIASPDQAISVDVSLGGGAGSFAGTCTPPPEVSGLRVEVSDPLNRKVEATSTVLTSTPPTARVSFLAPVAGRYHVYVIFDPNLGTAQVDALVVRDARTADARTVKQDCAVVQGLKNGTLLCTLQATSLADARALLIRPDDTEVPLTDLSLYAVSNDVIWQYDGSMVRRLVDTGAGVPAPSAALPGAVPGEVRQLLASDSELLVLGSGQFTRFVFDGTAIRQAGSATANADAAVVLRSGDRLFAAADDRTGTGPTADGFTLAADTFTQDVDPHLLAGTLAGVDAQGIWLGPTDPLQLGSTTGGVDTISYLTVVEGELRSQVVFRPPSGFVTALPSGMFSPGLATPWLGFTGGVPALVPNSSAISSGSETPLGSVLVPLVEGENVTFDLIEVASTSGRRFGQFGDSVWIADGNGGITVMKRGGAASP